MFRRFLVFWMLPLVFLAAAPRPAGAAATARPACRVCGMYIDQNQRTAGELVLKDGTKLSTCGVACLLRVVQDKGGPDAFTSIQVRDWESGQLLDADQATYVIGSRIIPDMLPGLIAFKDQQAAKAFAEREGGKLLDFTQALNSISPMGMTMPTRITAAVLPPKGALGVGVSAMRMEMDDVVEGTSEIEPEDFVRRPGQMMGPKKMVVDSEMLMASYGLRDDLTAGLTATNFHKKMESYTTGGMAVQDTENNGPGDLGLTLRYNFWRDTYFSRFVTLLGGVTLPTGDFDRDLIASPSLQLGTGAFTFTGGLLSSFREGPFWLHTLASYTHKLENSDDYRFGDEFRLGGALHYTPTYNLMLGLELDGVWQAKDEYLDQDVGKTGGFRSTLSAVADWKFLTALGGNFTLRPSAGMALYEDLNHSTTGMVEGVQMGDGWFVSLGINFQRRVVAY
ncbi:MAG: nitrous oxide reductase accessory protein NosL [Desulfobacteraceae bacterium]|nr:nitrous oxide reductase accessory protein NosL [Desulfobacteraceae bacterium]